MVRRVVVAGPPCAGKSTFVAENAPPGALVLDRDAIARELGSPAQWDHPREYADAAEARMRQALRTLPTERDAWIVRTLADPRRRAEFVDSIGAELVLLDVSADEAKRRAEADGRPAWTVAAIDDWWHRNHLTDSPDSGATPTRSGQSAGNGGTVDEEQQETPAEVNDKPEPAPKVPGKGDSEGEPSWLPQRLERAREQGRREAEVEAAEKGESEAEELRQQIGQLTSRITELEQELDREKSGATRAAIAASEQVPVEFVTGSTEDEMKAAAAAFKDAAKAYARPGYVPAMGTGDPAASMSSFDAGKARAEARFNKA